MSPNTLPLQGQFELIEPSRYDRRLEACCDIELDTRGSIIDVEPRNRPAELPDCCSRKPASISPDVRLQKYDEHTTDIDPSKQRTHQG